MNNKEKYWLVKAATDTPTYIASDFESPDEPEPVTLASIFGKPISGKQPDGWRTGFNTPKPTLPAKPKPPAKPALPTVMRGPVPLNQTMPKDLEAQNKQLRFDDPLNEQKATTLYRDWGNVVDDQFGSVNTYQDFPFKTSEAEGVLQDASTAHRRELQRRRMFPDKYESAAERASGLFDYPSPDWNKANTPVRELWYEDSPEEDAIGRFYKHRGKKFPQLSFYGKNPQPGGVTPGNPDSTVPPHVPLHEHMHNLASDDLSNRKYVDLNAPEFGMPVDVKHWLGQDKTPTQAEWMRQLVPGSEPYADLNRRMLSVSGREELSKLKADRYETFVNNLDTWQSASHGADYDEQLADSTYWKRWHHYNNVPGLINEVNEENMAKAFEVDPALKAAYDKGGWQAAVDYYDKLPGERHVANYLDSRHANAMVSAAKMREAIEARRAGKKYDWQPSKWDLQQMYDQGRKKDWSQKQLREVVPESKIDKLQMYDLFRLAQGGGLGGLAAGQSYA